MRKRILALLLTVLMVTALLPFGASAAGEKLIAVTFDDGPSQYTSTLLDGLAARGVKVTFFMQGVNAQNYTSVVRRAWNEGHQICSHTYNHPNLNTLSADAIRSQFSRTDTILDNALGFDQRYMIRPPYGNANQTVLSLGGVPFFYWSVDTRDWESRNADKVYNEFMRAARDGSIVLLHDIYSTSVSGALRAIDTLKSQGYQFVTVAELFYRRGVTLQNGTMYYNCYPNSNGTASALSTPVISQSANPNGGLSVSISGDSRGTIYYTTNGETPNPVNSTKYTGAFTVTQSCTVRAVTVVNWNGIRSNGASAKVDYIPAAAPKLTMDGDTMTMTCATAGATIRYTTDGSAPNANSKAYSAPITVPKGTTVKAVAFANGYNMSAVSMLTYTANGNLMSDVDTGAWYYPNMDRAVSEGIISGTAPTVMSPNMPLTRAMLVTMLYRLAKPEGQAKAVSFTDADKNSWYYDALCWANAQDIARGYPDNTFRPGASITRAELAAMLARYLRSLGHDLQPDLSVLKPFADGDRIADWAREDISVMVSLGVIRGYNDNTIGSGRGATRAEAVTMLLRAADIPAPEHEEEPEPSEEPTPVEVSQALRDTLDSVLAYAPDTAGSSLREYYAAAKLLNFCRSEDAKAENLTEQIDAYIAGLSEEDQAELRSSMGEVLQLAQSIAKGDVTQEEVDAALEDSGVALEPVDPQTFPHELLIAINDAVCK